MEFLAGRTQLAADFHVDRSELGSFDPSSMTPNASGRSGVQLLAFAEELRAEAVRRLVPFDDANVSIVKGFATPARHLAVEAGLSKDDAQLIATVTRFCARYALTSKALTEGQITIAQAAVLAHAERGIADHYTKDEGVLIGLAEGRDEGAFKRAVQAWRTNRIGSDCDRDGTSAAFAERYARTQRAFDGSGTLNARLDAEGMDIVENALHTKPDPAMGAMPPRTKTQRQADTLVDIAAHYTGRTEQTADHDHAQDPASPNPTGRPAAKLPNIDVVIDLGTLEGEHPTDVASIRAEFTSGNPLPLSILNKMLCDATYRRVLIDGASTVLDYGKPLPDIPRHLRKAVQLRDRHCQMPGCDRSWQWCDVHHIVPKGRHGPDSANNLTLLCRHHHTFVHKHGWTVTRDPITGRIRAWSP